MMQWCTSDKYLLQAFGDVGSEFSGF